MDLKDSDKHYVEKLASVCPDLRTVKLNINKESCMKKKKLLLSKCKILQESDEFVKYLEMMPRLQELIIDFPGSLGLGFNSFLVGSGTKLSQLGLSLGEYKSQHMKLIAEECKKLKILHLFFTNYTNNQDFTETKYSLPSLEGLDSFFTSNPAQIHIIY